MSSGLSYKAPSDVKSEVKLTNVQNMVESERFKFVRILNSLFNKLNCISNKFAKSNVYTDIGEFSVSPFIVEIVKVLVDNDIELNMVGYDFSYSFNDNLQTVFTNSFDTRYVFLFSSSQFLKLFNIYSQIKFDYELGFTFSNIKFSDGIKLVELLFTDKYVNEFSDVRYRFKHMLLNTIIYDDNNKFTLFEGILTSYDIFKRLSITVIDVMYELIQTDDMFNDYMYGILVGFNNGIISEGYVSSFLEKNNITISKQGAFNFIVYNEQFFAVVNCNIFINIESIFNNNNDNNNKRIRRN